MLNALVRQSRSIRSFKAGEPVPRETLLALCELARSCPAAMNRQPLKYRLVDTPEECAILQPLTRWAGSLSVKLPPEGREPTAFIVICHDTDIAEEKPIFLYDVGIVTQTIMLGASERGFGGCIIGSANPQAVAEALALPANIIPKLILGLGVPDETVILTEAEDGKVIYYRDEEGTHYVPKRPLNEILL
ncbi:MAG: nitroreductase family protein [Clostridia bacterium]|nr:nitroreductase family protein [Clostridia bacterium]